ncbi:MAG: hypothetical protein M3O02_10195 [Acidobacteriota bacterium]|nr:hypothetical protein [Acidobacteriota bacterium]
MISTAAVDPNSSNILTASQNLGGAYLHPDFSTPAAGGYGIPYVVVDSSTTPLVTFSASDSADSDNTLFPIPASLPIEGSPGLCWTDSNDHHAIVIDKNQCVGYEVYQADQCNGGWSSYGNVIWDFTTTEQRPYGMSSVDAAGLSVFEGLIRYDEIVAGSINHAIRFTALHTKNNKNNGYFTAPAVHAAGSLYGSDNIMGMRIRLRADFDVSGYSTTNQIILNAMKTYGMILADNGANMFFQGTPDARWNDNDLSALKRVPSTAFEVLKIGAVYDQYSAPTGPVPVINSFTASSSSVAVGSAVTLTPNVTGASYEFIDKAGFTRGPITVHPTATTTYTLTARNAYGTSTASTTVTVSNGGTASLSFTGIVDRVFGTQPFAVSASSNSQGAITYSVVSGPATLSGNVVTLTGVGTVTLKASQAASGAFGAASATASFNVTGATPSLTLAAISAQILGASPFAISATSNSQGAITYSVVSGPATLQGNIVTLTGTGSVTVIATQAASGNFTSGAATTSFTVAAAAAPTSSPTPTPTPGTPAKQTSLSLSAVRTKSGYTLVPVSNSPGAVVFTVVSGPGTISGSTVHVVGQGAITVLATQAAVQGYTAATATLSIGSTTKQ